MTIPAKFYPAFNVILNITNGYPCIALLFFTPNYVVNQFVSLRVPSNCGMVQANGLTAKILAVNTVGNTITLDLDTSGFDLFSFPGVIINLPLTIPAGEFGSTIAASVRDNALRAGYTPV